jgi:hypothetical protein
LYSGGLTAPPNGGTTVSCPAQATNPGAPPDILDACGRTVSAVLVGSSTPPACNGSVVWTYRYTACNGTLTADWTFTYTIDRADFTLPAAGAQTVNCPSNINIGSVTPPVVYDNCGLTLTPTGPTGPVNNPNPLQCGGTVTYSWNYADCEGNNHTWNYVYTLGCQAVTLKVMLEGAYDSTANVMNTTINANQLLPGQNTTLMFVGDTPSGQPYNAPPWNYNGNTGLSYGDPPYGTIPYPSDVVDWVLVTVRKNGIMPGDNIWRCAGWVRSNGVVTFPDNCSIPLPDPMDDYYIMVEHRNHLGVLSPGYPGPSAFITCDGLVLQWDFTTSDSYKPAFRVGQKRVKIVPPVWAMYAGNGDQVLSVAAINSPDRTLWRSFQNAVGYKTGDYDLNITTNSQDETIWKTNQNKTSGIIFY